MDACLSCLGLGRRTQDEDSEGTETSRLLYDDPYRGQYGSNMQATQRVTQQPDPEHLRQEREEMEGICHRMSDQIIDIFTVVPQGGNKDQNLEQAKALLTKKGIDPSTVAEPKLAKFAQQSLAGQQKYIEVYRQSQRQQEPEDESPSFQPVEWAREVPTFKAQTAKDQSRSVEEMAYKTIRRYDESPISIELGRNETAAAKAAIE